MQKSTENVAKSPIFCTLTGNRGRRIERRWLNLHRKFINNRFCACAVQMLLKLAVNENICSTFEVQYDKSTSTRTTAITHLGGLTEIAGLDIDGLDNDGRIWAIDCNQLQITIERFYQLTDT